MGAMSDMTSSAVSSSPVSGESIRQQIASKTMEAMSIKQKLKAALHASTVQALRAFQGQTLENLRRNSQAAHEAVYGDEQRSTGTASGTGRCRERGKARSAMTSGEDETMGPMILGDYTVHQGTPLPAAKSWAGDAVKLSAVAALLGSGIGLPAYAIVRELTKSEPATSVTTKTSFQDATLELSLPYRETERRERRH